MEKMSKDDVCNDIFNTFHIDNIQYVWDDSDEDALSYEVNVGEGASFCTARSYTPYDDGRDLSLAKKDISRILTMMGLARENVLPKYEAAGKLARREFQEARAAMTRRVIAYPAMKIGVAPYRIPESTCANTKPFDGLSAYLPDGFKVADGLIAKEKEGPTLDEEFPVQPNGFRWL